MFNTQNPNPVIDTQENGVPEQGMPVQSGVPESGVTTSQSGMPTAGSNDVDWTQKFAEMQRQHTEQINQLRSTMDRNLAQSQAQWQQEQRQYLTRIRELEMSRLDPAAQQQYQRQIEAQEVEQLRQQNMMQQQKLQEYETINQWVSFFTSQGVMPHDLDTSSASAVVNSGWAAMGGQIRNLRQELQQYKQSGSPSATPSVRAAPAVANKQPGTPSVGPSWDQLRRQYGSDERVYNLVEQGILPKETIPPV